MIEFLSSELLPKLITKFLSIRKERTEELRKISDVFGDCENLAKYYVEPNCQHGNPADEEDDVASPISVPILKVINTFFNKKTVERDGRNQLFILADAGMGKTSFLIMIKYFNLFSFWPKEYDCKLLKLGNDTIREIRAIPDISKTVLLLDALDEDPLAWDNYKRRLRDILRETANFRKVIITCRTQFFPTGKDDPFQRSGMISIFGYTCPVIYLSLFDDEQIGKYLSSNHNYGSQQIEDSKKLLGHMKTLKSRPLLLAHIQDFIDSEKSFDNPYSVYYALVQAWLNREVRKHESLEIESLWLACILVAVEMNLDGERSIAKHGIDKLIVRNSKINLIKGMDIGGRSLLNKNSYGSYRFSHYSIQEFMTAEAVIKGMLDKKDIRGCNFTKLTVDFLHFHYDSTSVGNSLNVCSPGVDWERSTVVDGWYGNYSFVGARASGAKISNGMFDKSNLYYSNFFEAELNHDSFESCELSRSDFRAASITSSSFRKASFTRVNCSKGVFNSVNFDGANLNHSDFSGAALNDCTFRGADLEGVTFDGASFTGSDFRSCTNLSAFQLVNAHGLEFVKLDENIRNSINTLKGNDEAT